MSEDLINRITYYLSSGGLFNPELADHLAVRNLLMECREALAQPDPKYIAFMDAPQRTWIGLTDEDKAFCVQATAMRGSTYELIAAIEAKLKEKNA